MEDFLINLMQRNNLSVECLGGEKARISTYEDVKDCEFLGYLDFKFLERWYLAKDIKKYNYRKFEFYRKEGVLLCVVEPF